MSDMNLSTIKQRMTNQQIAIASLKLDIKRINITITNKEKEIKNNFGDWTVVISLKRQIVLRLHAIKETEELIQDIKNDLKIDRAKYKRSLNNLNYVYR